MSRKIMKSLMGRDGQRRRSPRISALNGCKDNHQNRQLSRTRNKRKFDHSAFTPVSKLAKQVWKGVDSPRNEDPSTDHHVEWRSGRQLQMTEENQKHDDDHAVVTNGKASILPAKHILELVLDTLQRRDTYEIFAEPVDPDEVEDYYEIIKEPMDFGTMRAKLHEGMYQNLQQFEHDVFLIPENAMHFNSSATIYFRQARSIHELAKKVFHALKMDPENFESEFSGTRRRSMRKALSDTRDSTAKSGSAGSDVGTMLCPSTSTFRRTISKKNPAAGIMTDRFHARNLFTGSRVWSCESADRRFTYLYNEEEEEDTTMYSSWKPLVLMNQGDISYYKDSLMSYVKDLGPMAQMVAKRKLLGQHGSDGLCVGSQQKRQINSAATQKKSVSFNAKEFRTFSDFAPAAGCNPFRVIIDLTKDGEEAANGSSNQTKEKTDIDTDNVGTAAAAAAKEKMDIPSTRVTLASHDTKKKEVTATTTKNLGRDFLNCSSSRKSNNVRPVILALENSHSNVAEFKLRNRKSCIALKPQTKPGPACDEAHQKKQQQPPPFPLISKFTFDLPFLKARLNQMNALERGGELRC